MKHFLCILALTASALNALKADPPPTAVKRIEVYPPAFALKGASDARRLIVTGYTEAGGRVDLTSQAKIEAPLGLLSLEADGYLTPLKDGEGGIKISAAGMEASLPVTVSGYASVAPVSFVRDVMPILDKVGCTQGTCHGAAKGKNGFRMSLRGYDPEFDYMALIDDLSGRRFNRADPAQSLMLLKPTQGAPHVGGFLFDTDSRQYKTLLRWISEGVKSDAGKVTRVKKIELVPSDVILEKSGEGQQLLVVAQFDDGSTRDVTRDSFFSSSAFTVAEVTATGQVSALRRGETAIIVRYEGQFATANITVLGDREGYAWVDVPESNYVDALVNKKLKKIKAMPSAMAKDDEFLRRVYLDVIGVPPSPEEARAFLGPETAEPSTAKDLEARPYGEIKARRDKVIDALLERREYVDHWALKWSDLLQANRKYLGNKGVWAFRNWIREAVATNVPFDDFARSLLTGEGSTYSNPRTSYFRIARVPEVAMETTTQLFLGVRFMCSKCHDHPFEQWTQSQYYGLSAFFAKTAIKKGSKPDEEIIYERTEGGEVKHPKTGKVMNASFPFQFGVDIPATQNHREDLARWITDAKNPYFAKAVSNRVWSYFFGRGIIDPVNDIRASNPASNPELLQALTDDFIAHKFDLKHLIRVIVSFRTYQLSVAANAWNEDDTANFSHQTPRRLNAEQLLDSINMAAGIDAHFDGVPFGFLASELPDPKVNEGGFLDLFGRPPRESPCECERRSEVSLSQALNLVNGETITAAVADPTGRIAKSLAAGMNDHALVDDLYLAALTRYPTEADYKLASAYLDGTAKKNEQFQDFLWALINSPAFLFNR